MGRGRFSELIGIVGTGSLLSELVSVTSESTFRALTDRSLNDLFRSDVTDTRKVVALKSVVSLPKKRLERVLHDYITNDQSRYYNVIHWLDFGVSVSRERSAAACKRALARMRSA
jgi:hypothetical protein